MMLAALANNVPLVANQDESMVDNMAGEEFNHHTYWELFRNENNEEIPDERSAILIEG